MGNLSKLTHQDLGAKQISLFMHIKSIFEYILEKPSIY